MAINEFEEIVYFHRCTVFKLYSNCTLTLCNGIGLMDTILHGDDVGGGVIISGCTM